MEQSDLIKFVGRLLERLGIRYFITGSQATIAYGEPRFTNDIDVVVDLRPDLLDEFCAAFPEEDYYLSRTAAREAVSQRGMFNVIHPSSGLKIDVIIAKQTSRDELRFERSVRIPVDEEFKAVFSSPEDIIVQKLQWHEMGGGERHLRDIGGIIKTLQERLDRVYIETQAAELGVDQLWRDVVAAVESA